jgi:hypothetical protein
VRKGGFWGRNRQATLAGRNVRFYLVFSSLSPKNPVILGVLPLLSFLQLIFKHLWRGVKKGHFGRTPFFHDLEAFTET